MDSSLPKYRDLVALYSATILSALPYGVAYDIALRRGFDGNVFWIFGCCAFVTALVVWNRLERRFEKTLAPQPAWSIRIFDLKPPSVELAAVFTCAGVLLLYSSSSEIPAPLETGEVTISSKVFLETDANDQTSSESSQITLESFTV
jgi:hypothetical protein